MRTCILTPSALLLIVLGSGHDTRTAVATDRSTDYRVFGVAGNCPAGTGPMRPAGPGAAVDHNHDGFGCVRRGTSISGDSLLFDVDNDDSSAVGAPQHDPVWNGLYTGM